jgi:ferredoxin
MFMMKAKVDSDLCVGTGTCASLCPEVFSLDGEVSVVTVDTVPGEHEEAVRKAVDACPTGAILIEE